MKIMIGLFITLLAISAVGIIWMLIEMHNAPTMEEIPKDNNDKKGDD